MMIMKNINLFKEKVWLISLIREKNLHNLIKSNFSRIQFCSLINNSHFKRQ